MLCFAPVLRGCVCCYVRTNALLQCLQILRGGICACMKCPNDTVYTWLLQQSNQQLCKMVSTPPCPSNGGPIYIFSVMRTSWMAGTVPHKSGRCQHNLLLSFYSTGLTPSPFFLFDPVQCYALYILACLKLLVYFGGPCFTYTIKCKLNA